MELDIFVVDAFTEQQFKGNSAAVIPVKKWPDVNVMQNIAIENNLSETAFIKPVNQNKYEIRWFSPLTEIDFCGHATLASAHVLFHELGIQHKIEFVTVKVGNLVVAINANNEIEMSFPVQMPTTISSIPAEIFSGLSITPKKVLKNRQAYFAILNSEKEVYDITYDSEQLKTLAPFDVVVTAIADGYDFVSRYFWPANGGDEDPVTGSIHAGLAPYWAAALDKQDLVAYQASRRGGVLRCQMLGDRVLVSGSAVLYLKGKIYL